jgi:hypothetical protein
VEHGRVSRLRNKEAVMRWFWDTLGIIGIALSCYVLGIVVGEHSKHPVVSSAPAQRFRGWITFEIPPEGLATCETAMLYISSKTDSMSDSLTYYIQQARGDTLSLILLSDGGYTPIPPDMRYRVALPKYKPFKFDIITGDNGHLFVLMSRPVTCDTVGIQKLMRGVK